VVHFQYANAELSGIYQVLLRDACRHLFAGCTYVNLEEDLGIVGLRRTKLSYLPLRLEEKYEICMKVPGLQNLLGKERPLLFKEGVEPLAGLDGGGNERRAEPLSK
jgi:hypothetical protein